MGTKKRCAKCLNYYEGKDYCLECFPNGKTEEEKKKYCDDKIITLHGENDKTADFIEIAGIALNGENYLIVQPVELFSGMKNNEAIVFKLDKINDDEAEYDLVQDTKVLKAIEEEYEKLLKENK